MDLDDFDCPSKVSSRPSRFAPKGSKFKPQPRPKPERSAQSLEQDSVSPPKREDLDAETATAETKHEQENMFSDSASNEAVEMEVDAKPGEEGEPSNDPMSTEVGEDVVVREIDMYFTPSVDPNTQLYVLQYPLRPSWRPYDLDERCQEVRVKPASAEVEVDLAIDMDSKNFDRDADPRLKMEKQILSTSWKPPKMTGCAVGILVGNKLCLNPIHAVVQLRPSMQHLKPIGSNKKNIANGNSENAVNLQVVKEEKSRLPSKKPSMLGTADDAQKNNEEQWARLSYHCASDDISVSYRRKMVAPEGSPIPFSMSPSDYLNALCPASTDNSSKGPGIRELLKLPLEERYKFWLLKDPPIHRFDALKHLAPDESVDDILRVLQKHAKLVQGLWIPKSSLVYGTDQGKIDILARDFVLLLFSKSPVIKNSQLPHKPQLLKAVKEVLNELAVERSSLGDWKLKMHPDKTFIAHYPNIVRQEEQAWERLEKPITDAVFQGRNRKPSIDTKSASLKSSSKQALKSSSGAPSRTTMSHETQEVLPKAIQKLLRTHKVCSVQDIRQLLRGIAVSASNNPKADSREAIAAAQGVDASQDELHAIISQFAVNVHGVYILKSSPDHPEIDDLRKIVIDLFIAEGPNAKLKKASIIEAAKLKLKRDIGNNEPQKVLHELCVAQGSSWILKSSDRIPM